MGYIPASAVAKTELLTHSATYLGFGDIMLRPWNLMQKTTYNLSLFIWDSQNP